MLKSSCTWAGGQADEHRRVNMVKDARVRKNLYYVQPETHTKRQAAQHGCLFSLLGDGDKGIEIVYGAVRKKKIFVLGRLEQPRQNKNLLYRHSARQAPRTNQGRNPVICPLWVPIHLSFNSQPGSPLSGLSVYYWRGPVTSGSPLRKTVIDSWLFIFFRSWSSLLFTSERSFCFSFIWAKQR